MIKKFFVLMIAIFLPLCGCSNVQRYDAEFLDLFDTMTQIVGYYNNREQFEKDTGLIREELSKYHKLYNIYDDFEGINNIKTINDNAGKSPVSVDKEIIDLLIFGKEMFAKTNGKVNIALGSVLKIWHTYRNDALQDPENAALPPMDMLTQAYDHANIENLIIDENNNTVFLKDPEMSLDVGAIAKGYATQRVCEYAIDCGIENLLLSVGGNVYAIGEKNDGEWRVGIQNPDENAQKQVLFRMNLKNESLVTSGEYQRYFTVGGVKYNHIIDPDTLSSADKYASVTVRYKDSGVADVLSTALFMLTLEDGEKLLSEYENAQALWIFKDGKAQNTKDFFN